jgi:hypothetical protein
VDQLWDTGTLLQEADLWTNGETQKYYCRRPDCGPTLRHRNTTAGSPPVDQHWDKEILLQEARLWTNVETKKYYCRKQLKNYQTLKPEFRKDEYILIGGL